ncbi:MAG: DNRLRE domain-containing protein [Verrucomicrobia bacterium]|nr:DNRLRE domain-containing protein [Verrucomicrobiota bacterium]
MKLTLSIFLIVGIGWICLLPATSQAQIGGETNQIEAGLAGRPDVLFYGAAETSNWFNLWHAVFNDPDLSITNGGRDGNGLNVFLKQGQDGVAGSGTSATYFLLSAQPGVPAYHEAMYFRYYIRLDPNFPYVQGGKIPGLMAHALYGGGIHPDGTNGWGARYMWDKCGELYLYAYLPLTNGWGTSLHCDYRGTRAKLLPGKWHCLEQYIQLNSIGATNGICQTWLDGNFCQNETNLLFRTVDSLNNKEFGSQFQCFYGGQGGDWVPPYDTWIRFDNVVLATNYIGPRTGSNVLLTPVILTPAGTYSNQVLVSVSATAGDTIRYTSNGEEPGYLSQVYTGPVRLAKSATFKARAFNGDAPYSPTATATYTITPSPVATVLTNSPTDDSYVWLRQLDPTLSTNNYGLETTLGVKMSGPGFERRGLVKFSVANVTNAVVSAKLRMYVESISAGPGRITLLETSTNWSNTGVSWANRPEECDLVGFPVTASAPGWIEWDVSNYLSAQRQKGETALAFYLVMLTPEGTAYLRTKEYSNASFRPQLVINTTTAPFFSPAVHLDYIVSASHDMLTLDWGVMGWTLQAQTNSPESGLGAGWVDIPGTALVSATNLALDPNIPGVFYRLKQ